MHELYRAEFPDGTAYIGYTSVGIAERWAGEHNYEVQRRKTRYPKVRPVRVMTCSSERVAKRVEANLISSEALIVLNQRHTNGNSIWDQEAPPAVPDDADDIACELEKIPTIETADGVKNPNPLYKAEEINWDWSLNPAVIALTLGIAVPVLLLLVIS